VTDVEGAKAAAGQPLMTLILATVPATVAPPVYAVPVQLIAYHTAVIMGTDVDQPRNLAKSVTVE
jgi:glucosamine--fructose-6-phosphate aminotransferase (isomerizing)